MSSNVSVSALASKAFPAPTRVPNSEQLKKVLDQPIQSKIATSSVNIRDLHLYTLPADELENPSHTAQSVLARANTQKNIKDDLENPKNIVAFLSQKNIREDVLKQRLNNVFDYIFSPLKNRGDVGHFVDDVNTIVRDYKNNNPDSNFIIDKVYVYGKTPDAFSLAQALHVGRSIARKLGGRPVVYMHTAPTNQRTTSGYSNSDYKKVYFLRVEPETGAYIFRGKPHVYTQPFLGASELRATGASANEPSIHYNTIMPLDTEDNKKAFKQMIQSPKRVFARLVLSNESVGAGKIWGKEIDRIDSGEINT